jgi:hypothetical protein
MVRGKYRHRRQGIALREVGKGQQNPRAGLTVGRLKDHVVFRPMGELLCDLLPMLAVDYNEDALARNYPLHPGQGMLQHGAGVYERAKLLDSPITAEALEKVTNSLAFSPR